MNSTSEVEVAVLNADEEKGILSIEVTEHYTHPNGSRGNVSEVRTVIFEKEEEKEQEDNKLRDLDGNEIKNDNVPQKGVQ